MIVDGFVAAAVRAPSSHNTQPWLYSRAVDVIDVYADRTRALPVNDPDDRELTISCGAAVFNLQVASEAAGLRPHVHLLPDGGDADRLASVTLGQASVGDLGELGKAIWQRRTHRGAFAPSRPTEAVVKDLDAAAAAHGVALTWVPPGEERDVVARLVAEGDRVQFADPAWRRELASWMHPRHRGEGLVVSSLTGSVTRFIVSHFDVGGRTARQDEAKLRDAPLVGVLATRDDGPAAWLAAGQALQHVLLVAARHGIMAGYSNQPCQVPRLRLRLREALAIGAEPQAIIRLGFAAGGQETPRRPVPDVILSEPRSAIENREEQQ